ncbi:YdgA family protein [Serratia marcescens]|nr:YdgA family protein [Serratia marcescens]
MASVHTELENTPAVKGLFDTTKGKSLFTADSRISYSGTPRPPSTSSRWTTRRISLR